MMKHTVLEKRIYRISFVFPQQRITSLVTHSKVYIYCVLYTQSMCFNLQRWHKSTLY